MNRTTRRTNEREMRRRLAKAKKDKYTLHLQCTPKQMETLMKIAFCNKFPDLPSAAACFVQFMCENPQEFVPDAEYYRSIESEPLDSPIFS